MNRGIEMVVPHMTAGIPKMMTRNTGYRKWPSSHKNKTRRREQYRKQDEKTAIGKQKGKSAA